MTETEKALMIIWSDLLERDDLTIESDFFEFGGDSLQMMSMLMKVESILGVELAPGDFFDNPTIKGVARLLVSDASLSAGQI